MPVKNPASARLRRNNLVFGASLLAIAAFAQPAPPRPDILLIMPDQFRGDSLSILGHPVVRTPNLDALARHGVLFRRGYSAVPSCIPARYALLTGMLPQTSGIVGYALRPVREPTLGAVLGRSGYTTVLVGRNMHQHPAWASPGYQREIRGNAIFADDEYDRDLKRLAPSSGGIRTVVEVLGLDNNGWRAKPWSLPDELHPTAWIVRRSRDIVAETPVGQPLFLTTSFYAPHPPLYPPARIFDRMLKASLPRTAFGDWVDRQALRPEGDKTGQRVLLEGEALRRAQAGYFGLIDHIDEQIGPLIADFQARSRQAGRPWLIVVTSDHGEMLGDHGYFRKCEPYEGSASIPFLIDGSSELGFAAGTRSFQPVCLSDIMPTLLDLAGVEKPPAMDGSTLVPALRGTDPAVREILHLEHAPQYSAAQGFQALTDGRMKYIWRPANGREQLFSLDNDPHEENDLALQPAQRPALERWRNLLVRRLAERPEGFSDGTKLVAGRPYPKLLPLPAP